MTIGNRSKEFFGFCGREPRGASFLGDMEVLQQYGVGLETGVPMELY
jgi:hypothetical protein